MFINGTQLDVRYTLTLNQDAVTTYQDQTFRINATLKVDNTPAIDAEFFIIGFEYDLEYNMIEAGVYELIFSNTSNSKILAANYTGSILAIHNNNSVSTPFIFKLLSTDHNTPMLNILSPADQFQPIEEMLTINIEGYDDTVWYDVTVFSLNRHIFYLQNNMTEINTANLIMNKTYFSFSIQVNLTQLNLVEPKISVVTKDFANNEKTTEVNLNINLNPPIINWVSYHDNLVVTEESITLSWTITAPSQIKMQELYYNNKRVEDALGHNLLLPSTRQATIDLNIDSESAIIEFKLVVYDIMGNKEYLNLHLIYNKPTTQQLDIDTRTLISIIGLIVISIGSVVLFIMRNKIKNLMNKPWKGELIKPPLMEIVLAIITEDVSKLLSYIDDLEVVENDWNTLTFELDNVELPKSTIDKRITEFIDETIRRIQVLYNLDTDTIEFLKYRFVFWKHRIFNASVIMSELEFEPPLTEIREHLKSSSVNKDELEIVLNNAERKWNAIRLQYDDKEFKLNTVITDLIDFQAELIINLASLQEMNLELILYMRELMYLWLIKYEKYLSKFKLK